MKADLRILIKDYRRGKALTIWLTTKNTAM
jgi:hypothetical protein